MLKEICRQKWTGQSVLIVTVLLTLFIVVAIGISISQKQTASIDQNITFKRANQTYYVALHGINEAMATRMVPRSNQLNFRSPTNNPLFQNTFTNVEWGFNIPFGPASTRIFPVLSGNYNSGQVFRMPNNMTDANRIGIYRYLVLGGDPARNATDGNYLPLNQMVENEFFNNNSTPFIVVSNGITCMQDGQVIPGVIQVQPNSLERPTCGRANGRPTQLNEITLVKQVNLDVQIPNAVRGSFNDTAESTQIFNSRNFTVPNNIDGAPFRVFIPGRGMTNSGVQVDFESMWNPPTAGTTTPTNVPNSARLNRVLFYNSATRTPIAQLVIPQWPNASPECTPSPNGYFCNMNAPNPGFQLPNNASIKLFFDGPIDYRSPFNYNLNGCEQDRRLCKIKMIEASGTATYSDFNFLPLLPASTQVVITPTFIPGATNAVNINHIRDYAGNTIADPASTYHIQFRVQN